MSKTFSQSDVASHNKSDSLWIVVDGDVYDLTKFQDDHPGGKKILQRVAGKDASKQFWKYHNEGILKKYQKQLQVGSLDSKPKPAAEPMPVPVPQKQVSKPKASSGVAAPAEQTEALETFGQQIPFGDPAWYQSVSCNPYYLSVDYGMWFCVLTLLPAPASLPLLQRDPRSAARRGARVGGDGNRA